MPALEPYPLPSLLPDVEFQTLPVLRRLASTHRYLAELKGTTKIMPNQGILIDTLTLQEAKASSGIRTSSLPTTNSIRARYWARPTIILRSRK